jgi:hypothetical protein
MSGKTPLAKAIRYALARLPKARPYLDHGVLELDNNTAERAMRSVAIGRKNYLFVGSQTGGKAAAIAFTLICLIALIRGMPCPIRTSTCRSFTTISSGLGLFMAIVGPPLS